MILDERIHTLKILHFVCNGQCQEQRMSRLRGYIIVCHQLDGWTWNDMKH